MSPRARRAYSDAAAWMRSRVPPRRARSALAAAALTGMLIDSLLLLALIGLFSPASFGAAGSRAFGSGSRTLALAAIVAASVAWLARRFRTHRWLVDRAREPFRRPLEEDPAFAGASGALAAARAPLQTRFTVGWIWAPALGAVGAVAASLTTAYFLVDAVIARFEVGWQQPVLAGVNFVLAWLLLRTSAGRLAVWPLAVSVHREATAGYP